MEHRLPGSSAYKSIFKQKFYIFITSARKPSLQIGEQVRRRLYGKHFQRSRAFCLKVKVNAPQREKSDVRAQIHDAQRSRLLLLLRVDRLQNCVVIFFVNEYLVRDLPV